jgi:SulP family sulfate permease
MHLPRLFQRRTIRSDAVAGVVLGVESVPDGLAGGLLAGVNPVYGLYAYMVGTFAGGLATSSAFMAVQATGAMAIVIADVDRVTGGDSSALFTLSLMTGAIMLVAGLLRLGTVLRFVSNAVVVGFINAVGINIILGQLSNFTGYAATGGNRVTRAIDTVLSPRSLDWPTVAVGAATIVLIVLLERTPLKALGMVVAIVVTSAATVVFGLDSVERLDDIADIPRSLPLPQWPEFRAVFELIIPALSLAFVGLVQGAAISANFTNPDGTYPDASRDFAGQGVANLACGMLQAMPVGGSMSGTSLVKSAGAKSRQALIIASAVMAAVILLLGDVVGYIAMPALAGLLMLIGFRTVKPTQIVSVWRSSVVSAAVLSVTFVLTMLIPLQYAVLAGVGLSVVLRVIQQSNQVKVVQRRFEPDGRMVETDPPATVPPGEVLVLQPYGSLFFASAPVFKAALPEVTPESVGSVVILRLRGRTDLGSTFLDVLKRYATELHNTGSKLVVVSADERLQEQFVVTGLTAVVGSENVYERDEWVGASLRRAHDDAKAWVAAQRPDAG